MNSSSKNFLTCVFALLIAFHFSACKKASTEYYEVADSNDEVAAENPMAEVDHNHGAVHDASVPHQVTVGPWSAPLPEAWVPAEPGSMQEALFIAGQPPLAMAQMSVSVFPGDVGGVLANVNRWRRQVGLGPIAPEAVNEFITAEEIAGRSAWRADFTGPSRSIDGPDRIVVSVVERDGQTWFFKLNGSDTAVESNRTRYDELLHSLKDTSQ